MFHTVGSGIPASGNGGQHFGDGEMGIGAGAPNGGLEGPQRAPVVTPPLPPPASDAPPPQLLRFLTPTVILA